MYFFIIIVVFSLLLAEISAEMVQEKKKQLPQGVVTG